MRKYDYWIRSGKFNSIHKLSTLLMGIISFMILARMLGAAGYGVWGLFLMISSITETARVSLIRNAFIRFINQTPESEHPQLQTAAFILSFIISGILSLLFFILSELISTWLNAPGLQLMLQWYALIILLTTLFAHIEMLLSAKMDFRGVCWIYCIRQGLLLLIITVCFVLKLKLTPQDLSIYYLVSIVAGSLAGIKIAAPYLAWNISDYKTWIPKLWNFGKYVFGTNASATLFRGTDNFITANYFSPVITAYYNASLRIGNLADLPSQVIGDIVYPKVTQYDVGDKESICKMYEKTVGAILTFSIPALLFLELFPSFILKILAGNAFVEGVSILRVTAFFGFTLPFIKQFGTIMDGTGHPEINFKTMLFAFCFNILTNIIGVHFFGVIGAAFGTATTYFVLLIITQTILYKKFGIRWTCVFKNTCSFYPEFFRMVKYSFRLL
ncbi:MAG: oligosaccharide flippase family protein [Ginsengibacter sp.]